MPPVRRPFLSVPHHVVARGWVAVLFIRCPPPPPPPPPSALFFCSWPWPPSLRQRQIVLWLGHMASWHRELRLRDTSVRPPWLQVVGPGVLGRPITIN